MGVSGEELDFHQHRQEEGKLSEDVREPVNRELPWVPTGKQGKKEAMESWFR